jgi:hypothetical protein
MRRVIALSAAALGMASFSLSASAQEYAAPIPFRLLSDPAFLPVQGQWYGSSAFDMSERNGDVYDSTNTQTAVRKGWEDAITQELQYGITNDLAVSLSDTYVPYDKSKEDHASGVTTENERSGFHDPVLGVTWRAIDQANRSPVSVDLLGTYQANLIDARTDNVAEGGQSGQVGAAISKVMPGFTVYGKALAEWYGSQSEFNSATSDFAREQSYWDYLVDLDTQTRLNDLFSINAGIGYVFANSAGVANVTSGVSHLADPGNGLRLNAALNYAVIPNMVASLTYNYARDNTDKELFATPASDTFLRDHDDNQFGVKLAYVTP